jgi:DNA invertase Pin-like site-specific DNA recombinase
MIRAAIYAALSTLDDSQNGDNQLARLRRFAARQNWEIVAEYVDHDGATRSDRAEFRRFLTDATQRRFDVVLFWAPDGFAREGALESIEHLEHLSGYGVGYGSLTERYLDSCGMFKDTVVAILLSIAKQERVRIGDRVRAGLNRAPVHGTRSGRAVGRPKALFDRQKVIDLRRTGLSWRQIARRLGVGMTTARRAWQGAQEAYEAPKSETRRALAS